MTLGVDVSLLFADMCLLSQYPNMLSKKMIYLYLENYAELNPSLALLAINTFVKECGHPDPKIRGLALRSLCGLRSQLNSSEIKQQVVNMLADPQPYVQRTAVYGCLKLHHACPNFFEEFNLVNQFYNMLRSPHAVVVVAVINVLNEVLEDQGGMATNTKIISYLLGRIKDFNDYGASVVFDLIARYTCRDEKETLYVLNILDSKLKSASSNLVFAVIRVFLTATASNPDLHAKVFERVKESLITMLNSASDELKYSVLCHVLALIQLGGAKVYAKDYKRFFCEADEKSYNQEAKLRVLEAIVTSESFDDIFNELCQYINEVSISLAQKSVLVIGHTAVKFPERTEAVFALFNTTLNQKKGYLTDNVLIAARCVLGQSKREFSKELAEFFNLLEGALEGTSSETAKRAYLWLCSTYCEKIEAASYLVEKFVNDWWDGVQMSDELKLEVINSAMFTFFKKPKEMLPVLSKLFTTVFERHAESSIIVSKCSQYYGLLRDDPYTLEQQFAQFGERTFELTEDSFQPSEKDINSLVLIYKRPAETFTKELSYFSMKRCIN